METKTSQGSLRLAFGVHRGPQDAPMDVVRMIAFAGFEKPEAKAIEVCMESKGLKLAYVAAVIGKSVGYVCRLRNGERDVPKHLVGPLCAALGSNLLKQVRAITNPKEHCEQRMYVRRAADVLSAHEARAA